VLNQSQVKTVSICEGNSLFLLDSDNRIRVLIALVTKSQSFDMFILFLIALSSIMLALDNPLNDPESDLMRVLSLSDIILTSFFALEAVMKIISIGFLFNGENSYLRNGWNLIDFVVVVISIISMLITSMNLKIIKIFRLLRILRPFRVISRNKGLKIGIQALIMAIPSLFNVLIISLMFFMICGIIGVNYFKGTFFSCEFGNIVPLEMIHNTQDFVNTKYDCLNQGGEWINADQNFDNVFEAMSTLFQVSTTEGWI
jgi:hypothetical protein